MSLSTSVFKRAPWAALAGLVALIVIEAFGMRIPYVKDQLAWRKYFHEDVGGTIKFDPNLGYRLGPNKSRQAQISWGTTEYVGAWFGNNHGFQDLDDFTFEKSNKDAYRILVFGDSATAAPYLQQNWPDAVERMAAADGVALELIHVGQDGTGLSNWWATTEHFLKPNKVEADAVIFAIAGDGMRRAYSIMAEHDGHIWFGEFPYPESRAWRPEEWPKTFDEAKPYMRSIGPLLSTEEFDRALAGDYSFFGGYSFENTRETIRTYMLPIYDQFFGDTEAYKEGQSRMIREISAYVMESKLRAFVLSVPLPEWIVRGGYGEVSGELQDFAASLGGETINGNRAFMGLTEKEIRARYWLPYDGHWAQSGSDHFAEFMYKELLARIPLHPGEKPKESDSAEAAPTDLPDSP